ncbi:MULTISPECIES: hypothetical protein [unclassified Pseudactinotalea]|uniref:hypothetical protein n=1 Tax=unclassified Pseudactinotalea TaxID=2649176 RepID=UPI00128BECDC|nr:MULTISPECIES: hypothetical protein [unclassified Pseudactinotalea]MPV49648.1 hypothetical protein [Pseudactinotalea sp. HY160]QGH69948.1 hypothetical protein GCE65_10840 [Pseudactinotalea sp. HY158]
MSHSTPARRRAGLTVSILAGLALAATAASLPAAADTAGEAADPGEAAGVVHTRSHAEWQAWAGDLRAELEGTDWAALSRAAGCELTSVSLTEVVDPEANEALGAPADLALPVVEREEHCAPGLAAGAFTQQAPMPAGAFAAAAGSCEGVTGGRACISRSGSYVTGSYTYYGSGTTNGFSRLYKISSLSGCPRGTTMATSGSSTLGYGDRSSITTALGTGSYSMHFWRKVFIGHSDTGGACAYL